MSGRDRWRIYGLAARAAGQAFAASLHGFGTGLMFGASRPTRLLVAPQDLRTSDATIAQDVYAGTFVFAGRAIHTGGRSPFAVTPPDMAWSDALNGFGWLRHLRAADTSLARENARALVSEALAQRGRGWHQLGRCPRADAPRVAARRLISFLYQSPLLLTGADHGFYNRFMRKIARDVRLVERALSTAPKPLDRLWAAMGLCFAGLCCDGLESKLRRGTRALARELDAQILADGGHVGRNPGTPVELLLDLLPLRQLFVSRSLEPPPALDGAIGRAMPMIKLFRHGDGELALFNGMGRLALDHLATLLSYDHARGEPAQHATYSGYSRLEAGGTVVIADLGRAPPVETSEDYHAGCLSFEFSAGLDRVVVNCGTPLRSGPLREAARLTAAHSTATLAANSSARFLTSRQGSAARGAAAWLDGRLGRIVLEGPGEVTAARETGPDGSLRLVGHHAGYLRRFGLRHERRLALAPDGSWLEGRDAFLSVEGREPGRAEAVVRFHLHPAVEARLGEDGASVVLVTAKGGAWRFAPVAGEAEPAGPAAGHAVAVEDSVFFADADERRPTRQIVVTCAADADGRPRPLAWRFEKADVARSVP